MNRLCQRIHCVLLAGALTALPALGEPIVLVSGDRQPYVVIANTFSGKLNRTPRVFTLPRDGAAADTALRGKPELVLAIGAEAARFRVGKSSAPTLYAILGAPIAEFAAQTVPSLPTPETQIATLRRVAPELRRIGTVVSQDWEGHIAPYVEAAKRAGLEFHVTSVRTRSEIPSALAKLKRASIDVLWLVPDVLVTSVDTIRYLLSGGVTVVGFSRAICKTGALLSFEPDYAEIGTIAAEAGNELLRGGQATFRLAAGSTCVNERIATSALGRPLSDDARKMVSAVIR